jgi:glycosyltransferase involved in cell wall biosynthesis
MRILLLTPLFQPEPNHLRGLAFAKELIRYGHTVEVLTGFPNYPGGKVYDGYKIRWRMREVLEGIPVTRVAMYPSHDRSAIRRTLSYLTHSLSACIQMPYWRTIPDIVYVYLGPITLTWPAIVFRTFRGVPFVMDVADLWPESVSGSGMLENSWVVKLLHILCSWAYSMSSKIIVPTKGFKRVLCKRGVPCSKIELVHHWCDEQNMHFPTKPDRDLSEKMGFNGYFNVVYAGNMGLLQALDSVLDAAELLASSLPQVHFYFIGDGVEVQHLKKRATDKQIPNVKFRPAMPAQEIGQVLSIADALLIHLKDDPLSQVSIPQKTQAYMSAGRPILMAVRGDAAEFVKRAGAGLLCAPEDPHSIAEAIRLLVFMSVEERDAMGENGRKFYQSQLSFRVGVQHIEAILLAAMQRHT